MAPKKTNIKIKRSKFNLYNKKKSKARRALKIVITVIVVCGLGVLGYGLGKPLVKYFQDRATSQPNSETSALISSIKNAGSTAASNTASENTVTSDNTSQPPPAPAITDKVYYLPDNAAESEASLTAALADAKKSGCKVVAATLKDSTGYLLYKTNIAEVKDTEVVTGKLSASQISSMISKEGFVPAARINTLMDRLGCTYVKGSYRIVAELGGGSWHDNKPENGGKLWLSPFKTESADYIAGVTSELSSAGFKQIICVNTRFPAFHTVDIEMYLADLPLTDPAKRLDALWSVVNAAKASAEKNGAELWLEMSAKNIIAENRNNTDAEPIGSKDKLTTVKIAVNYDIAVKSSGTTSSSSGTSSKPTSSSKPAATSAANSSAASSKPVASSTPAASSAAAPSTANTSIVSRTAAASSPNTSGDSAEYTAAKEFAAKAKSLLGSADFGVRLPQTLTGKALEDVTRAFNEADIPIL